MACLLGTQNVTMFHICSRPIAQIPQCTRPISHNASFCNRNVHVRTFLLRIGALWDICLVHCGIWEMGLLLHCIRYHMIMGRLWQESTVLMGYIITGCFTALYGNIIGYAMLQPHYLDDSCKYISNKVRIHSACRAITNDPVIPSMITI